MTAILAAPTKHGVLVGSDRALTDLEKHGVSTSGPKVLRVGTWLIGLCSTYEGDWDALAKIDPPDCPDDWTPLLPTADEEAQVLLVRGRVVRLGEVYRGGWCWGKTRGAVAIGSGGSETKAAWTALQRYERDPEKRMRAALSATARGNRRYERRSRHPPAYAAARVDVAIGGHLAEAVAEVVHRVLGRLVGRRSKGLRTQRVGGAQVRLTAVSRGRDATGLDEPCHYRVGATARALLGDGCGHLFKRRSGERLDKGESLTHLGAHD